MPSEGEINQRLEFANFLRRLSTGKDDPFEWNHLIATHYRDELLEEIRRKTAKLAIDRAGGKEWSDSEFASLQLWSRQLRASTNTSC